MQWASSGIYVWIFERGRYLGILRTDHLTQAVGELRLRVSVEVGVILRSTLRITILYLIGRLGKLGAESMGFAAQLREFGGYVSGVCCGKSGDVCKSLLARVEEGNRSKKPITRVFMSENLFKNNGYLLATGPTN